MREAVAGTDVDDPSGTLNVWTVWAQAPATVGDWGLDARAHCATLTG